MWYRKAAARDQPDALVRLAEAARDATLGQTRDMVEAERLFRRAAERGQPMALFNLATMAETGGESPADVLRIWRDAADKGVAAACDRLGRAYRDGELAVAVDDAEARKWFQRATDLGDPGGTLNLGAMLILGRGGPVDEARALGLYRRAAELGSVTAEANIGGVYWMGAAGIAKDRAEAVRHYQIAARGGNIVAERMLSVAYGTGDGIERDDAQQLVWARKAAEQGAAVSQNTVGYLILTGVGGTYDYVEAAMWLTLAAERSAPGDLHDLATENLHTAMAQLKPEEQAEVTKRAAHWREVNGGA
jgi:TPR repeat protein